MVDLQTMDFEPQQNRAYAKAGQDNNEVQPPASFHIFFESWLLKCQW